MPIHRLAATAAVLFLVACTSNAADDVAEGTTAGSTTGGAPAAPGEATPATVSATGSLELPATGGPAVFWTLQGEGVPNTFVLNVHLDDARLSLSRPGSMRPQPGTYRIVAKDPADGDFEILYASGSPAVVASFEGGSVTITESSAEAVTGTLTTSGTLFERKDPANMMAGVTEKGPFTVKASFTATCRPEDFGSSRNVCD